MVLRSLCVAIVLCASDLWGAAINGYVLNPFTQARIPGIPVAFYVRQDGEILEMLRKETDAEGRFSFAGPFLQSGLSFGLAAFYDDIPYFSSTLEAGAQQQVILEVYEKTDDPSGIRIGTHHLFFALRENAIECIQLLQIHNTRERTYAGRGDGRERQVTELVLPMGIFNLQSHSGLLHQAGEGRFFDNQPLPPGRSQRSLSFNLDARNFASPYVHQVIYPTDRLEVFLDPPSTEIKPPFIDLGIVEQHGRQYRKVTMENLQPSQQVAIPLPFAPSLRWSLKWVALAGAFLAGGVALALSRQHPSTDRAHALKQRQHLIEELARLDDSFADRPEDPHYMDQRALLMREAVALAQALDV
ncbi:MAG: hypothetical protein F4049_10305 [Gemmatimonadetes bacterium]|nr:hypothetical protein [Gemmatimonadota bacterium]MYK40596.1 hypothetical protein [Gemmatimonadota bacterium]